MNDEPRFSVVITSSGDTHYLNGVPLTDDEIQQARNRFGEPEDDTMPSYEGE